MFYFVLADIAFVVVLFWRLQQVTVGMDGYMRIEIATPMTSLTSHFDALSPGILFATQNIFS